MHTYIHTNLCVQTSIFFVFELTVRACLCECEFFVCVLIVLPRRSSRE